MALKFCGRAKLMVRPQITEEEEEEEEAAKWKKAGKEELGVMWKDFAANVENAGVGN